MLRRILRALGFRVHRGWRNTHRSGFCIKCVGCGERRSAYQVGFPPIWEWWETTCSGDGSCGDIPELPTRWH